MNQDLGSIIGLIMERPDLISEIKRIAEAKSVDDGKENESTVVEDAVSQPKEVGGESERIREGHSSKRRSDLIRALSPFVSKERHKAMETFLTIADILETMRGK